MQRQSLLDDFKSQTDANRTQWVRDHLANTDQFWQFVLSMQSSDDLKKLVSAIAPLSDKRLKSWMGAVNREESRVGHFCYEVIQGSPRLTQLLSPVHYYLATFHVANLERESIQSFQNWLASLCGSQSVGQIVRMYLGGIIASIQNNRATSQDLISLQMLTRNQLTFREFILPGHAIRALFNYFKNDDIFLTDIVQAICSCQKLWDKALQEYVRNLNELAIIHPHLANKLQQSWIDNLLPSESALTLASCRRFVGYQIENVPLASIFSEQVNWAEYQYEEILREKLRVRIEHVLRHSDPENLLLCAVENKAAREFLSEVIAKPNSEKVKQSYKIILTRQKVSELVALYDAIPVLDEVIVEVLNEQAELDTVNILSELNQVGADALFRAVETSLSSDLWQQILESVFIDIQDAELQKKLNLFETDSFVLTQKMQEAVQRCEKRLFYAVYQFVAAADRREFLRGNAVLARGYAIRHSLTYDDFFSFSEAGVLPVLDSTNRPAFFERNYLNILGLLTCNPARTISLALANYTDSLVESELKSKVRESKCKSGNHTLFQLAVFGMIDSYPKTRGLCLQFYESHQDALIRLLDDARFSYQHARLFENAFLILLGNEAHLDSMSPPQIIKLLMSGVESVENKLREVLTGNKSFVRKLLDMDSLKVDLLDRSYDLFADYIQRSKKLKPSRIARLFQHAKLKQLLLGRHELMGSVSKAAANGDITLNEDDMNHLILAWPMDKKWNADHAWSERIRDHVIVCLNRLVKNMQQKTDGSSSSSSNDEMHNRILLHIMRSSSMIAALLIDLTVTQYQALIAIADKRSLDHLLPSTMAESHPFVKYIFADRFFYLKQKREFQVFAIRHPVLSRAVLGKVDADLAFDLFLLNNLSVSQAMIYFEQQTILTKLSALQLRLACRTNITLFRFFSANLAKAKEFGILPEDFYYAAARLNDEEMRMSVELSRWMKLATAACVLPEELLSRMIPAKGYNLSESSSTRLADSNSTTKWSELKLNRLQKRLKQVNEDPQALAKMFEKKDGFFCSNVSEVWSNEVLCDAAVIMLEKRRNQDADKKLSLTTFSRNLLNYLHSKVVFDIFSAKPVSKKSGLFSRAVKSSESAAEEIKSARLNIARLQQAYLDLFIYFKDTRVQLEFVQLLLDILNSNYLTDDGKRGSEGVERVRYIIAGAANNSDTIAYLLSSIRAYYEDKVLSGGLVAVENQFGILKLISLCLKDLSVMPSASGTVQYLDLAIVFLRSQILVQADVDLPIMLTALHPILIDFWLIYPHLYQLIQEFDELKSIVVQALDIKDNIDDQTMMSCLTNEPLYVVGVARHARELLDKKKKPAVAAPRESYQSQVRRQESTANDVNLGQLQAEIAQLKQRLNSSPVLSATRTVDVTDQATLSASHSEPFITSDLVAAPFAPPPPPPPPPPGQARVKNVDGVQSTINAEVVVLSAEEKQLQDYDPMVGKIILQMLSRINLAAAKQQSSIVIKRVADAVFGASQHNQDLPRLLDGEAEYVAALAQLLALKVRRPFMKKVTDLFDCKCHDLSDQATVYRLLSWAINPTSDPERDVVATSLKMELGKKLLINDAKYLKLRNEKGEVGAIEVMLQEYYVGKVIDSVFTKRNHEGIKQLNQLKSDLLDSVKREVSSSSQSQAKSSPKLFTPNQVSGAFNPSDITQVKLRSTAQLVESSKPEVSADDPRNSLLLAIQGFNRHSLKKSSDQDNQATESELKMKNS